MLCTDQRALIRAAAQSQQSAICAPELQGRSACIVSQHAILIAVDSSEDATSVATLDPINADIASHNAHWLKGILKCLDSILAEG